MKFLKTSIYLTIIHLNFNLQAQPGWRDFSKSYGYNLKDAKGKSIVFKDNATYKILINKQEADRVNFDRKELLTTLPNSNNFFLNIAINDFIYQTLLKPESPLTIAIVKNKKDTMYLSSKHIQTNSGRYKSVLKKDKSKNIYWEDGIICTFQKGCFYFNHVYFAMQEVQDKIMKSGQKINNFKQELFKVSHKDYSYMSNELNDYSFGNNKVKYDSIIEKRINNCGFAIQEFKQKINITNTLPGYETYGAEWIKVLKDEIIGMFTFVKSEHNTTRFVEFFGALNKKTKKITLWKQTENPERNYHYKIGEDLYNQKLYMFVGVRDSNVSKEILTDDDKNPFKVTLMESLNYGETWEPSNWLNYKDAQKEFRRIIFDSLNTAIVSFTKDSSTNDWKSKRKIVFHLYQNQQLLDSLMINSWQETTNGEYYCNEFYPKKINDSTIMLGTWVHRNDAVGVNNNFFHPKYIIRNNKWVLDFYGQPNYLNNVLPPIKQYHKNFYSIDKRLIYFNHGDSIHLQSSFEDVIATDKYQFIINNDFGLLSFDKGKSWFYVTAGIKTQNNYTDLKSFPLGFSYYDMKKLEFNKISICK